MASTFRPALLLMSGRSLGFIGTFFIPLVLVRIFDQAGYSTYKQLFLIFGTLYAVAQAGMAESLYYFLPSRPHQAGRYAMNAVLVLGLMGLLCLGLLQGAAQRISHWFSNGELSRHITLLGIYLLWMLGSACFEIVMIARKRHLPASFCYAFSDTVRAMFFVIPALLTRSLEWVLLGGAIFAMVRLGVTLLYFAREFRTQLKPDVSLLREQLGYALPFASAVLLETVQ